MSKYLLITICYRKSQDRTNKGLVQSHRPIVFTDVPLSACHRLLAARRRCGRGKRVRRERDTAIAILGERDRRHSENECQSVCHIEAVSLALGRFYFDSAIGVRLARCPAPQRVPERSRAAPIRTRPPRKIRNIAAPGLSQTGGRGTTRAVCVVCVSACVTASECSLAPGPSRIYMLSRSTEAQCLSSVTFP